MFKRLLTTAALVLLTAASANAQTFTLVANLHGGEETPAPGLNTGAFGTATIVVNLGARTVSWDIEVFNLPSALTAGHIHVGARGTPGPTMVNFTIPGPLSNDFRLTGSAFEAQFLLRPEQGVRSADDAFQAILGGNTYVNLHTAVNPGGEIRGHLVLQQP